MKTVAGQICCLLVEIIAFKKPLVNLFLNVINAKTSKDSMEGKKVGEDLTSACKRIFAEFGVKIGKQMLRKFYQARKTSLARRNLREQAEAAREIVMNGADADTVEEAVIAMLINRAMEVVNEDKITPTPLPRSRRPGRPPPRTTHQLGTP